MSAEQCSECPVAAASRRAFLRDVGLAVVAAIAASPAIALAESVIEIEPERIAGRRQTYAIPPADSVSVDVANEVILARWQNRVYAFSMKCPHRGASLEWRAGERRVFCPKHKARFHPDGTHDSGRASRDLDRYDVTRQGESIVVNLDALRRLDREPDMWRAALISLA